MSWGGWAADVLSADNIALIEINSLSEYSHIHDLAHKLK